jgi:hypothetical protein
MKKIVFTAIAIFGLAAITMAQVPNYVPTNGLVGWWPFNANPNDQSGNGNNLTNNNSVTYGTDRFSQNNASAVFNGINQTLSRVNPNLFAGNSDRSISFWINQSGTISNNSSLININNGQNGACLTSSSIEILSNLNDGFLFWGRCNDAGWSHTRNLNIWYHVLLTYSNNLAKLYVNNSLLSTSSTLTGVANTIASNLIIGGGLNSNGSNVYWKGKIDDIGIWNRVLTQTEITALYNGVNCANNTTVTPQTNSITTGSTAIFIASSSDPNPSYIWQSNFGQGFQTLNNFGNYTGANSSTLNISNVQLSEHNQPVRVITTSGNCIDTSNVAVINILDTCIVTVYDTLLTTVTDTLVINATITGLNPPNNLNTLKVFPNPASTHITIDYGNFNAMSGYTLKIVTSVGQTVFTTPINQQTSYIDLSTWTGNGIYFVQIIDTQNNTIENRKIVLQ